MIFCLNLFSKFKYPAGKYRHFAHYIYNLCKKGDIVVFKPLKEAVRQISRELVEEMSCGH